jgi:hypothetical protein
MVATFIVKSEAFMQRMISLISKAGIPPWSEFLSSLLGRFASDLDQWCFILGLAANTDRRVLLREKAMQSHAPDLSPAGRTSFSETSRSSFRSSL